MPGGVAGEPSAFGAGLAFEIFAGEKPAGQRKVRQDRKPEFEGGRNHLGFDGAVHEAVFILGGDVAAGAGGAGNPLAGGDLPAGEVRVADVTDLASGHEVVEGAEGFVKGRARVGKVNLVEVEMVGVEAAEAGFDGLHDVAAGGAFHVDVVVGHGAAELAGDDGFVAMSLEGFPEVFLGEAAGAVDVGGVEEGDAGVEGGVGDGGGLGHVTAAAEIVATEPNDGNL